MKKYAVILAVILTILCLTGCSKPADTQQAAAPAVTPYAESASAPAAETAGDAGAVHRIGMLVCGTSLQPGFAEYAVKALAEKSGEGFSLSLSAVSDRSAGLQAVVNQINEKQGDLFLIPADIFVSLAGDGNFIALENSEALTAALNGADLSAGWVTGLKANDGKKHLYGIPLSALPGLGRYFAAENGILCISANTQEADAAMSILLTLCTE